VTNLKKTTTESGIKYFLPAIDLYHLSNQLSQLTSSFDSPQQFSKELQSLFLYYGYRVQPSNLPGTPNSYIHDYHVPPSLLKQIQKSLSPKINESPDAALLIAKDLWTWHDYGSCLLAAYILGKIPQMNPKETIQLLISWLVDETDLGFYQQILDLGLWKIQTENSDILVSYIEDWLADQNRQLNLIGLYVLSALITNKHFENLPALFNIITPYLREYDEDIRPIIVDMIKLLIKRSPVEIAFLLRKNYEAFQRESTAWLIRHTLSFFPKENQINLRKIIHPTARR
jgi:hypothetical protein